MKWSIFSWSIVLPVTLGLWIGSSSLAYSQFGLPMGFGNAGESADSENARGPMKLKLDGILKPTTPKPESLALLNMTVGTSQDVSQFEVRAIEIPDYPEESTNQLLQSLKKYKVQMVAIGDKAMLTKIGQALPDTPTTVVGLFIRRHRTFQVLDVDVFRLGHHPTNSGETIGESPALGNQETPQNSSSQ